MCASALWAGVCACVQDPRFEEIVKDLQLQPRGTGGEHTAAIDDVYDVSNRARLKKSEVLDHSLANWDSCPTPAKS